MRTIQWPVRMRAWSLGAALLVPLIAVSITAQGQDSKPLSSVLSGSEILLEFSDPKSSYAPGVYSLNPADPDITSLRLLVKGGHRPVWSVHHKRFAYVFNGDIWISDKEGNKAALNPSLPDQLTRPDDGAVQWQPDGSFTMVMHNRDWGSKVYFGGDIEEAAVPPLRTQYSEILDGPEGVWPLIPFKQESKTGLSGIESDLKWQDVLATNNASLSPGRKFLASEVYPAAPWDLKRAQSRVLIYDLFQWTSNDKENKLNIERSRKWFSSLGTVPPVVGPGRRLTNLSDGTTELMPLWSPSGKWVALTLVDYTRGYVVPAIIQPNGKGLLYLTTASKEKWGSFEFLRAGWLRVTNNVIPSISAISSDEWGHPNRTAIKWSEDGQYLWMRQGKNGLYAAKLDNGQWVMRQVAQSAGGDFGILLSAFNGPQAAWIESSGDRRKIKTLKIAHSETMETKSMNFPPAVDVVWMDW